MADVSLELAVELVKAAIERVARAQSIWKATEQDARSSTAGRLSARNRFDSAEREFAWQWENVKRIFEEKGI